MTGSFGLSAARDESCAAVGCLGGSLRAHDGTRASDGDAGEESGHVERSTVGVGAMLIAR